MRDINSTDLPAILVILAGFLSSISSQQSPSLIHSLHDHVSSHLSNPCRLSQSPPLQESHRSGNSKWQSSILQNWKSSDWELAESVLLEIPLPCCSKNRCCLAGLHCCCSLTSLPKRKKKKMKKDAESKKPHLRLLERWWKQKNSYVNL